MTVQLHEDVNSQFQCAFLRHLLCYWYTCR